MNRTRTALFSLAAVSMLSLPSFAQQPTGSIHGKVTNPAGQPIDNGTVLLTKDPKGKPSYTFNVDQTGTYKGDGIAPDTYTLIFRQANMAADKVLDQIDNVKITAGQDLSQDDDMSRQAYLDKLSPDERKKIEEYKAKNAEIVKSNAVIKNLNADLTEARSDNHAKNYQAAADIMKKDIAAMPNAAVLYIELGVSQLGLKQYDDAKTTFQKAYDLNAAEKTPSPELAGVALSSLGEVAARDNKPADAQTYFDKAAAANPAGAAQYYFNETVIFYQAGNAGDAQAAAADKAITAGGPNTKPIIYYLKAQGLTQKASVDPKTNMIILPPGTVEAYQKYLELDPQGQFAADSQQVLAAAGQKIETKYKAGKKN